MEDKLTSARQEIGEVDRLMASLFERRMRAVKEIALYKKERGLPIFDATREKEIIAKNSKAVEDAELQAYYVEFIQNTMDVSKQYQRKIVEGTKIAYSGIEGAFAYIAARRIFPEGELVAYKGFLEAYSAVERGECDVAVLPLENSYAGEVGSVMDIMFNGGLYVNGLKTISVAHCLLGTKDSELSDITQVTSHPQALAQCAGYIERNKFKSIQATNTALAAKDVSEKNDKHIAAIASEEAGKLYGLKVLAHTINESDENSTRFRVFSRSSTQKEGGVKSNHLIIMFTVRDEAGALAKAMNVIGAYGYSMSAVRSRPMKSLPWQYYFYVEADGDGTHGNEEKMLTALAATCDKLKVLGSLDWSSR